MTTPSSADHAKSIQSVWPPWLIDYPVGLMLTPVCIHFCETDDCLESGFPLHTTGLGSSFHSALGFSLIKNTLPCFSWISKINWCNSSVRKKCARFHVWFPRSFMSGGRRKRGHEGGLDRDSRLPQGQGLWVMCFPSPETRMSIRFTKSCLRECAKCCHRTQLQRRMRTVLCRNSLLQSTHVS